MATTTSTATTTTTTACHMCGQPALVTLSHYVGAQAYAHVWCGYCGFGHHRAMPAN